MSYAELHGYSYYSFHDGASSVEEMVLRAREWATPALALTDHHNLCGALELARCARAWGLQPIIGAGLTSRERMEGEYRTLALYPKGYLMAHLRPSLPGRVITSREVRELEDGAEVLVAGLVIRRQRPATASGVVFLTLEDEHGHTPCVVWPQVYRRYRALIKESVLLDRGAVSRRDGTMSVVVRQVQAVEAIHGQPPKSKDWG